METLINRIEICFFVFSFREPSARSSILYGTDQKTKRKKECNRFYGYVCTFRNSVFNDCNLLPGTNESRNKPVKKGENSFKERNREEVH